MIGPYATAEAFRTALEARLRNLAAERGTDLQRLQRRVAFERLLARLFAGTDPPWLLKGGYALEMRLPDRARSTVDLDLWMRDPGLVSAHGRVDANNISGAIHEHLQEAVEADLGDGFSFLIPRPRILPVRTPVQALRFSAEARLAGRPFARFHLDVAAGDVVLGQPEWVEGARYLDFAGIAAARVALYPPAQHFAEKVHAYTFPWEDRDNTRVKDLVDMVLLVHSRLLRTADVLAALHGTFGARGSHPLPQRLAAPPADWKQTYEALAGELALPAASLDEAFAYLGSFWHQLGLNSTDPSDLQRT